MKKIILILSLFLLTTSCATIILNEEFKRMGVFQEESKIVYLSNGTKEVAYIEMHHFGKKEFYDHVSFQIDSLQKQEYTVFYEGVAEEVELDSLKKDRNARKLRKLLGVSITAGYLDTETNKFAGKYQIKKKHKLINQPEAYEMNIDTTTALRADISPNTMIREFEKLFHKIELDNCDLQTSLDSKLYDCERIAKSEGEKFFNEIVKDLRDKNLANEVIKHKSNKIAIVYGFLHLSGMRRALGEMDNNWQYASEKNKVNN